MSDYPQYPSYPNDPQQPYGGGAPAPVRPSSIDNAVKLMYVGAGLSLLSLVLGLITLGGLKDDITESMRDADPNVSQSTIDVAYTTSLAMIFVIGLLGVLLWVWMAWKNGQGRSWARVVATVLGVLNVLITLLSLGQPGSTAVSTIFNLLTVALAVVILVLLWKRESTQYYEAVTRSRMVY
ncbi:hypothetical protein [Nocardioides campestrisoli]|uniref:hypothetical protein n=1 Tax=Nocardioides campestrisoli TaxID=2736757 RepID=UPI0015E72971|nr:hypothetical protein [Nocardioides campestrisoli]